MKKHVFPLILCFVLALPPLTVSAAEINADEVAPYLTEIINFINDNYMGDIDQQKMLEAALSGIAGSLDDYSEYYTGSEYENIEKNTAKTVYTVDFSFEINKNGEFNIVEFGNNRRKNSDGLRIGDRIDSINGISTAGLSISEMRSLLTSASPGTIALNINRSGQDMEFNVKLLPMNVTTITYGNFSGYIGLSNEGVNKSVGYIKIDTFGEGTADEFREALTALRRDKKTRLLLDLRGNTGGYVDQAISVCDLIVPSGTIITTKNKAGEIQTYKSTLTNPPFEKIVVLVDGMTASASEIIASALQDSGMGIVVGEQTFGKGVMQSVVEFGDVGTLKLTMFEYFSRNGKKIDGVGITPDYEVDKVLFVDEKDKNTSVNVKNALMYLGYNVSDDNETVKSIGKFQQNENLTPTYKLNAETVGKMNLRIFEKTKKVDRTMLEGYLKCIEN